LHVVAACSALFDGQHVRGAIITLKDRRAMPAGGAAPHPWRHASLAPELKPQEAPSARGIVGRSAAIREVLRRIACVATTPAPVLVLGETGTGKELVARAIHDGSPRAGSAFVKVNCAAVPRDLFESEFFGHLRGAFTGAVANRSGRFELADGGTLFLDEIGELPLELQGKLLTVLQEGRFERIGESRSRQVDVRVVAATNREIPIEIAAGRFRSDLYYRLSVFPIHLPPLRERREDIGLLAQHIGLIVAGRLKRAAPSFRPDQIMRMMDHPWPGNVRELQNVIERAMIEASPGDPLELDLPTYFAPCVDAHKPATTQGVVVTEAERKHRYRLSILSALQRARGKIGGPNGAAALMGLKPTTLRSRIKALGIEITASAVLTEDASSASAPVSM
jgi:transcriptional regulator with GAF, ATPase, and Fis domain